MKKSIDELKSELERRKPYISGSTIVDVFGKAAYESWDGALALIEAFNDLENETGEKPRKAIISDELYLVLKSYWSSDLGEDILKLDSFLKTVKG